MLISQSVTINCGPEKLYRTLMSAKEFGNATGASAEIEQEEGGAFSCFGGRVVGRHIELMPNKRIVQAWRVGPWPESVYSIVKFEISNAGASSTINLEHRGFPEDSAEHLESGWHKMYWDPLKSYLE